MKHKWTREDIIVAYALYCVTPHKKINISNKTLQQVALLRGLKLNSLILRMHNFSALDPDSGKAGYSNVAKADKLIFEEFKHDWGELSYQAELLTGLAICSSNPGKGARRISSLTEKSKVNSERAFFRNSVRAAYSFTCCFSDLQIPELLKASHIKPYSKCRNSNERTNLENGLLLNTFYDKAFDRGLVTVTPEYTILVASEIKNRNYLSEFSRHNLVDIEGKKINMPDKNRPAREYLEYHNNEVFRQ